ncbi:MAG: M28 family peptidase [Flavobacteriales bacterium]|nr:M28 family peptidase [Flavobacteriales bacterium]
MKYLALFPFLLISLLSFTQSNIFTTNPVAGEVLKGNYNPANYAASNVINHHDSITKGINLRVNPDSLKAYLFHLATFQNRNTGSDTTSLVTGIGAARKWVHQRFQQISAENENRLVVSYLQFDQQICNVNQHKNILAVLPGTDSVNHEVIIIEGHIDSRCSDVCDSLCLAEGMEDNGSGTALVLELARVMSRYTYKNTIVFMATIGEEQGLYGANAFAQYAVDNSIPIKAVLNNDVIGGIYCGQTSSPPSCPGYGDVDSLQVRLFSYGGFNSSNKQLARFIKLQYKEELVAQVAVPMLLSIMSAEDRTGRGGDHIPFRQKGFPAMRFTSANEHGDASNGVGYTDRQHTSSDILGVDTNNDLIIDSFFVDFNYLSRNAVINGVGATMAAIGPFTPNFSAGVVNGPGITINITTQTQYNQYRVGIRTVDNDWDSVYTISSTTDTIYPPQNGVYFISVASADNDSIESLFSYEVMVLPTGVEEMNSEQNPFELLQNKPNPFDEATIISVKVSKPSAYKTACIEIRDIQGKLVETLPISLTQEVNEVIYDHGYGRVGIYSYSLVVDDVIRDTKRMIFAN